MAPLFAFVCASVEDISASGIDSGALRSLADPFACDLLPLAGPSH